MSTQTEKFLIEYKKLEATIKNINKSVLDYENTLSGVEQEKLKVCRIIRNYLSHNDMTFILPTTNMIKFITDLELKIRRSQHTVNDEFVRTKLVTNLTIKNLIPLVDKRLIPIQNKQGIFILTKDYLIHQLAIGNKKLELPKKLPSYKYVSKDTLLKNLSGLYIVTSDGTEDGKYLGILHI